MCERGCVSGKERWVYLGNVEAPTCALAVAKHDEYVCFLHCSSDAIHLWRFFGQGVGHVFVNKSYIRED